MLYMAQSNARKAILAYVLKVAYMILLGSGVSLLQGEHREHGTTLLEQTRRTVEGSGSSDTCARRILPLSKWMWSSRPSKFLDTITPLQSSSRLPLSLGGKASAMRQTGGEVQKWRRLLG